MIQKNKKGKQKKETQNYILSYYTRNRLTPLSQKHTKMRTNQLNFIWNFC